MKILVTGGGGFAGLHLLRELLREESIELLATVLGDTDAVSAVEEFSSVTWLSMDVRSDESVEQVIDHSRPDIIYHLAGQASVGESFEEPLRTWEINATGTLRVINALGRLSRSRRRLLLISSAEVYGAVDPAEQPIAETAPLKPVTPYGSSKAAAELAVLQMGPVVGVEVVVARSFNHIGPGQDERFVLPSMALQLARMRSESADDLTVHVGNLEVERDFLDVRDVVRAYVQLVGEGDAGRVYNVCSGSAQSLLSVVQRLVELSGTGVRLEVDPDRLRPIDVPLLVGDCRALTRLGWKPSIGLDETLRDLLREAEGRA
ncbi:MAG: GDP-mannose 4,6-dehydratase [Gemmatimonadota bacterium]